MSTDTRILVDDHEGAAAPPVEGMGIVAKLGDAYGRRLPEKLKELAGLLERVKRSRTQRDQTVAIEAARTPAHRLRGTAGSYGFRPVSEAAGRIEDALVVLGSAKQARRRAAWSIVERAALELTRAVDAAHSEPRAEPVVASARLLVIADDPDFLARVQVLARGMLVDVVCVRSEVEAIERARRAPPDAAIARFGDTLALARSLRSVPGCEALPLAFVSSEDDLASRMTAVHAGASMFLREPLDAESFGAVVRQLTVAGLASRAQVLVVDDDPAFCDWVQKVLGGAGIALTACPDPTQVLASLERVRPDVLLLDGAMPGLSGLDVCRILRADPCWQDLPVLFLTGDAMTDSRMAAFQAGADDFLAKPVLAEELLSRVRVRAERARLRRERAEKDPLTGLLLRGSFLAQVGVRLAEAQREQRALSLCLIDLDEFKRVNDTYGHLAGDRVLAGLGELIATRFRVEDVRGRWGGEEFAVAFPGQSADTIEAVIVRVLAEFGAVAFVGDHGERFHERFSAGVATFPDDGHSVEALLRTADRRLYLAKAQGRGRVIAEG